MKTIRCPHCGEVFTDGVDIEWAGRVQRQRKDLRMSLRDLGTHEMTQETTRVDEVLDLRSKMLKNEFRLCRMTSSPTMAQIEESQIAIDQAVDRHMAAIRDAVEHDRQHVERETIERLAERARDIEVSVLRELGWESYKSSVVIHSNHDRMPLADWIRAGGITITRTTESPDEQTYRFADRSWAEAHKRDSDEDRQRSWDTIWEPHRKQEFELRGIPYTYRPTPTAGDAQDGGERDA